MKKHTSILLAAALLLAGCAEKDDTLRIFCWSEYVPQAVIKKFTEETGINVAVEHYPPDVNLLQKVGSGGGNYDLIQPSEHVLQALIKEDLVQEIDHTKIPNLENIAPEFRNMPFDPGNKHSVPYMAGFVGIVYNAEVVPGPIVGYRDVFTPEHDGRIVVLEDAREIVSWGLATAGIPINDASDGNLATITPLLQDWIAKVQVFDADSPKTVMQNGDADIGIVWSGEAARLFEENPRFQWVMPAEGVHMFVDSLAIPRSSRKKEKAEAFMNFILRPEISKMISDEFPYYNPNAEARKLLGEKQLNNPASYPPGFDLNQAQLFTDIGEQTSKVEELVKRLRDRKPGAKPR